MHFWWLQVLTLSFSISHCYPWRLKTLKKLLYSLLLLLSPPSLRLCSSQSLRVVLLHTTLPWTLPVRFLWVSASGLLPLMVGVRLLPQLEAGVFGSRSHTPSNRYRRLFVAPVAHLERQRRGSLGSGSSAGRIQNSFPEGSHFIQGTHPFFGLLSHLHPGQGLGTGRGVSASERSHRTGSTSFPGLLQPSFCNVEGLWVVATNHRALSLEPHGVEDTFQDGDPPVHTVICLQGGLDGLHRPPGCISSDSNPSGIQKISTVHDLREGLLIQDPLFWSSHSSASLHAGHGSGFGNSSQSWHSAPPISGRLAESGVLLGAGSPVFEDGSSTLQVSGDSRQLGEISA